MTVHELISDLRTKGITLRLSDGKLTAIDPDQKLDSALLAQLRAHKSELIKSIGRSKNFTPSDFPDASNAIDQSFIDQLEASYPNLEQLYVATPMQKGMVYHGLLDGSGAGYTVQMTGELHGHVDLSKMQAAWDTIIARHDIFRTCFVGLEQEDIHQLVLEEASMPITYFDWRHYTTERVEEEIKELRARDKEVGFDFSKPPLMRLYLIFLDENRHMFLWTHHHVLLDAWCMGTVFQEMLATYEADEKSPVELPDTAPYSDFIAWLNAQDTETAKSYWKNQLRELEGPTQLGLQKQASADGSRDIQELEVSLDESTALKLDAKARSARCTLNVVVQAAWSYLLHRYSGNRDVVFGTTVSGRPPDLPGVETMVGLFINTVPVRVRIDPDQQLAKMLEDLNLGHAEREQFSFLALSEIQSLHPAGREKGLFETKLGFANYPEKHHLQDIGKGDRTLVLRDAKGQAFSNYAIDIIVSRYPELTILLKYDPLAYSSSSMDRLLKHFTNILTAISDAGDHACLRDLDIFSESEKHQVLVEQNDTKVVYPEAESLHSLFEAQCERCPNDIAIVHGERSLTFEEVNAAADSLAHSIASCGVLPDTPIGLYMNRSPEMVISLLAILKAGGAYVPLDPDNPDERLKFIAQDCEMQVCVTTETLAAASASWLPRQAKVLAVDHFPVSEQFMPFQATTASPNQLAAIIYTSGSTGRPKGVMLEHHSIINRLQWGWNSLPFAPEEQLCQKTTISFGDSICETLAGILKGRPLHIVDKEILLDPGGLERFLQKNSITRLVAVPSLLSSMLASRRSAQYEDHLRVCVSSGEELPQQTAEALLQRYPGCRFFNYYGSTETTADACSYEISGANGRSSVPIGKPIANVSCYVLSPELAPMPQGCVGELYVGGKCLARGYWRQPSMTAEKFIQDPFSRDGRLFKTGDLVRRLEDGNLEFVGRVDSQIKIRGVRIEPAEIEAVLEKHKSVEKSVVTALDRGNGSELIAYVVLAENVRARLTGEVFGRVSLREELQHSLAKSLPKHMMPTAFVYLDALPVTPSGKLDILSLPEPQDRDFHGRERLQPDTLVEDRLCKIWQDILGLEEIGVNEDFFDLGGHSLLATRLISVLRSEFDEDLPLQVIYENRTVRGLAKAIDTDSPKTSSALGPSSRSTLDPILPLRTVGDRSPIFCVHPGAGLSLCYGRLAELLPRDRPVFGLQPACLTQDTPFPPTMEALAEENLRLIRSIQPQGPYHLLGFSFGGLAAHAIACAFSDQGDTVKTLAILDVSPENDASKSQQSEEELIRGTLLSVRCDPDELFPDASPTFSDMIAVLRERDVIPPEFENLEKDRLLAMQRGIFEVQASYNPRNFSGNLLLFEGDRGNAPNKLFDQWSNHVSGKIEFYSVNSDHYGMIDPGPIGVVGEALARHLETVDGRE